MHIPQFLQCELGFVGPILAVMPKFGTLEELFNKQIF